MSPSPDDDDQLAARLNRVREIEKRIQGDDMSERKLPAWQTAPVALGCGAVLVFWFVWTGTWPIPRGKENHDKAAAFLKREFPNGKLRPSAEENSTAPVAAVFYVIRSGSASQATKAIQFAAEQNFGYASPYVIERLESDDPQLRRAARNFLRKMAGKDYGPNATDWKDWWRDPPRSLFGVVTAGHYSVQMGIPIASGLLGVLLLSVGPLRRKPVFSILGSAGYWSWAGFYSFPRRESNSLAASTHAHSEVKKLSIIRITALWRDCKMPKSAGWGYGCSCAWFMSRSPSC